MITNGDDARKKISMPKSQEFIHDRSLICVDMLLWLLWPRNAANNYNVL